MTEPIRVLVVDDEAPQMKALCHILNDNGYVTEGFTSAQVALDSFKPKCYELLLTDLMMPGIDGIGLLQKILQRDPDIVGILMTGAGTIATAVEAMKAGAFDYLLKPFTIRVLLPILSRALAMRALRLENARLQRGMRERTEELEAANKELEAFSYSASHDLNAPLRSINHFSSILEADHAASLNEEGRMYLSRIRLNTARMSQLINDLLLLSKISRNTMAVEDIDITLMAREIAAGLQEMEPTRQVELGISDGLVARGDRGLTRVLLSNLIGNAWKYSGKRPRARINVGRIDGSAPPPVLFVQDNGAGFDMAKAGNLFAPFHRMHRPDEFPGSGIGLSIVARIVHRHGGRIWAESVLESGSTFFFTLAPEAPTP